jgi:hypothetical protein
MTVQQMPPRKGITKSKLVFMGIVVVVAGWIFLSVVSNITHSFDVLNAPTPEHK